MKIHHVLASVFSLICTGLLAQTKKIAFESHSGSPENFHMALANDLFGEESDYGLPPDKKTYKLDSVIFISDSVSVLVSKEYKRPWDAKSDSLDKFIGIKKDTILNDPLLSRKNLLDSIKKMVDNKGPYETTNKTKFVGFDNKKSGIKKSGDKQQQLIPVSITNDPPDDHSPFDFRLTLMLGLILFLSLLGGWISWKFYQPRLQPSGV